MDVNQVLPTYSRLLLKQLVNNRVFNNPPIRDYIIADVFTSAPLQTDTDLAPKHKPITAQGQGENIHPAADEKAAGEITGNLLDVTQIDQNNPPNAAQYAHQYRVFSYLNTSDIRRRMENRVRRYKRARLACPYCNENGDCSKPFIRCGDRLQYSIRENSSQHHFSHHCNYDPRLRGDHVLIVDDDERMVGFCKNAFSLFLNYDIDKILTACSIGEAFEIFKRSKIEGRRIGLLISDIAMPQHSGFDLVNELYYRNFDIEILLMKDEHEDVSPPSDYAGNIEILPGKRFVTDIIKKPFHSQQLIDTIKKLQFGHLLA